MSQTYFHVHLLDVKQKDAVRFLDDFLKDQNFRKTKSYSPSNKNLPYSHIKRDEIVLIASPAHRNWISIYGSSNAEDILMHFAEFGSKKFKTKCFFFMLFENDVFLYSFYKDGSLLAEYNSSPNYFEENVSNKEILESKEDSAVIVREFPQLKKHQTQIKTMLTEGWIISKQDFERSSPYLDSGVLMDNFGKLIGLEKQYLNINAEDMLSNADFFKRLPKSSEYIILKFRKKNHLWIWLIILLIIFSGKLIQLFFWLKNQI